MPDHQAPVQAGQHLALGYEAKSQHHPDQPEDSGGADCTLTHRVCHSLGHCRAPWVWVGAAPDCGVSARAGKERLAACLGVSVQEAARFLESFLQKYKKIKDFAQATIARCHQTGKPAAAGATGGHLPAPTQWLLQQRAARQMGVGGGEAWGEGGSGPHDCPALLDEWGQKAPPDKSPEPGCA